jgi:RNA polymerase sigma-70 factor (ECF subfamily)
VAAQASTFDALFRAHHRRVWAYAARRVGRDDAYDILSETFLIAFRKLPDRPGDELPWLLTIARHVCANHMRSLRRTEAVLADLQASWMSASAEPDIDVVEALTVRAAFRSLEPPDQEILMLVSWDGLSRNRAAEVLGCSTAAFAVRLHRARRRLISALEDREESGGRNSVASVSTGRSPT